MLLFFCFFNFARFSSKAFNTSWNSFLSKLLTFPIIDAVKTISNFPNDFKMELSMPESHLLI